MSSYRFDLQIVRWLTLIVCVCIWYSYWSKVKVLDFLLMSGPWFPKLNGLIKMNNSHLCTPHALSSPVDLKRELVSFLLS